MLPKSRRVGAGLFKKIIANGKNLHTPYFSLRLVKTGKPEPFLLAVVVPKKVEKKAVRRNKLKRRIMAVARQTKTETVSAGWTGILFAKTAATTLPFVFLKQEVQSILKKVTL